MIKTYQNLLTRLIFDQFLQNCFSLSVWELGAMYVNQEGMVVEYQDKPTDRLEEYNAFWCAFAFRRRNFFECINYMEKSTLKQKHSQNEITQTPIFGSKVIEVENYIDLGTWPEIRRLLIDYEKDNN